MLLTLTQRLPSLKEKKIYVVVEATSFAEPIKGTTFILPDIF